MPSKLHIWRVLGSKLFARSWGSSSWQDHTNPSPLAASSP